MEHDHIFIRIFSTFIHKYMNYNYLVPMFLCLCARKIWRALLILLILLSLINVSPTSGFTNYIDVATLMPNGMP